MTTEPLMELEDVEAFRTGDPQWLLGAATQEVRSYCGWHVAPSVTHTVTVGGSGAVLLLPTLRLTGITSITQDGTEVDVADVTWKPNGVVTGCFFGCRDYAVTFTHGYTETPMDLARVVATITDAGSDGLRRLKAWTRGPFGETYEDGASGVSADRAVLDRYKLPSRP